MNGFVLMEDKIADGGIIASTGIKMRRSSIYGIKLSGFLEKYDAETMKKSK